MDEIQTIFFSRSTESISSKLGTKHPWVQAIQVCSNEGPRPFQRGDTDPEAYYYTTGTLNGLHELERFQDGTKRFGNGTKRFGNETKRFENGTLCIFGNRTLCMLWSRFHFSPIFGFPCMANRPFVYLLYGKMIIKVFLI